MPALLKLRDDDGPSIFLLPAPTLSKRNVRKAGEALGQLAADQRRAWQALIHEARSVTLEWLDTHDRRDPYAAFLET